MSPADELPCWIYRSPRKQEMYLYLGVEDDFTCVPAELLHRFGEPAKVMQLSLHAQRKLAREDVTKVMENLVITSYSIHYTKLYEQAGQAEWQTQSPTFSPCRRA